MARSSLRAASRRSAPRFEISGPSTDIARSFRELRLRIAGLEGHAAVSSLWPRHVAPSRLLLHSIGAPPLTLSDGLIVIKRSSFT
jgi:hypothetical protein